MIHHTITREEYEGFTTKTILAGCGTKKLEMVYDFDQNAPLFLVTQRGKEEDCLHCTTFEAAILEYNRLP
jgi:hypothetical protein